ncbi:hypothetical protein VTO73DRAFT_10772 [Trametes versicolor]
MESTTPESKRIKRTMRQDIHSVLQHILAPMLPSLDVVSPPTSARLYVVLWRSLRSHSRLHQQTATYYPPPARMHGQRASKKSETNAPTFL